MASRNTNQPVNPGAGNALDALKFEIANELGIANYNMIDKGSLPSRTNGYVGGNMTKKMIAFAEQSLQSGAGPQILQSVPTQSIRQ